MKANELMIDGLFRVKKDVCLPKGTIVVIRGIDADKCFPKRNLVGSATCLPVNSSDGFTYGVWAEYLEPIPLTPDEERSAVKIAREEIYEWLQECLPSYILYCNDSVLKGTTQFIKDLKEAMNYD